MDHFSLFLGLGNGAAGFASFDAVCVRDLTSKRYEYIYGLGTRLAKLEYEGSVDAGQVYYYHQDILGSTVMVSDVDGQVTWRGDYAPFGEALDIQTSWGNPYTYLGNEDDGSLRDFGARFYDARVGRFISPDPIKNVATAAAVNPYTYCGNNPLKYTDRFGLMAHRAAPEPSPVDGGHGHGPGISGTYSSACEGGSRLNSWIGDAWAALGSVLNEFFNFDAASAAQAAATEAMVEGAGGVDPWYLAWPPDNAAMDETYYEYCKYRGEQEGIIVRGGQYTPGNEGVRTHESYFENFLADIKAASEEIGTQFTEFLMSGHGIGENGEYGIGGFSFRRIAEGLKRANVLTEKAEVDFLECASTEDYRYVSDKAQTAFDRVFGKGNIRVNIFPLGGGSGDPSFVWNIIRGYQRTWQR